MDAVLHGLGKSQYWSLNWIIFFFLTAKNIRRCQANGTELD